MNRDFSIVFPMILLALLGFFFSPPPVSAGAADQKARDCKCSPAAQPEEEAQLMSPRQLTPLPPPARPSLPTPPLPPPSPPPENQGAINPRTGEFYPPSGQGVINPHTGEYYPPSGRGYIDPKTGQFFPAK